MNRLHWVLIVLLLGLSGCVGVASENSSRQLEYHPVLDGAPGGIPFPGKDRGDDLPREAPAKPLPIEPLKAD